MARRRLTKAVLAKHIIDETPWPEVMDDRHEGRPKCSHRASCPHDAGFCPPWHKNKLRDPSVCWYCYATREGLNLRCGCPSKPLKRDPESGLGIIEDDVACTYHTRGWCRECEHCGQHY